MSFLKFFILGNSDPKLYVASVGNVTSDDLTLKGGRFSLNILSSVAMVSLRESVVVIVSSEETVAAIESLREFVVDKDVLPSSWGMIREGGSNSRSSLITSFLEGRQICLMLKYCI